MTLNVVDAEELGEQIWVRPERIEELLPISPVRGPETNGCGGVKPGVGTGLWTSSRLPDGLSDWVQWAICEDFELSGNTSLGETDAGILVEHYWRLSPSAGLPVIQVATVDDLNALAGEFGHRYGGNRDWGGMYRMEGGVCRLDFYAMAAAGYVGVNLTDSGQRATRDPGCSGLDDGLSLYGWDCESTVWLGGWPFVAAVRGEPMQVEATQS